MSESVISFTLFLHQNSRLNSGGSRPSDKRGGSHPDPEIRGGGGLKKNFIAPSGLILV